MNTLRAENVMITRVISYFYNEKEKSRKFYKLRAENVMITKVISYNDKKG